MWTKYSTYAALVAVLVASTTVWMPRAEAQNKSPREKAQVYFDRGAELYAEGKYAKSIVQFRKAHRTYDHPVFLYNVMRSHIRLGQCEKAVDVVDKIEETKRLRDKTVARMFASSDACQTALRARELTNRIGEGGASTAEAFESDKDEEKPETDKPDCPPGKARNDDTAGHCCWPGQGWNGERCVGRPQCPGTTSVKEDGESCGCPGPKKMSYDGIHCCWPKQAWSDAKGRCVGEPKCPDDTVRRGIDCLADNDGDDVGGENDTCPGEAETVNGFRDTDGCPEALHVVASLDGQKATLTADGESAVEVGGSLVFVNLAKGDDAENGEAEVVGRGFVVSRSGSSMEAWLPDAEGVTSDAAAFPGCWEGQDWEVGDQSCSGTPECPRAAFEYEGKCYLDRDDDKIALQADACPLREDTDDNADTDGCPGSAGRNLLTAGMGVPYGGFAGLKYERLFGVRWSVGLGGGITLASPGTKQSDLLAGFVGEGSVFLPDLMGHSVKVTVLFGPTLRPDDDGGTGTTTVTQEEADTLYYGPAAGISYSYIGQIFHFRIGFVGVGRFLLPLPRNTYQTLDLNFEAAVGVVF